MAKLELPVQAFTEDFATRAFPNRNWARGSGINDLVIKSFAVFMQPYRHELDVVKIGQSVMNYQFMRTSDLDEIAANWGQFRQTGSRSVGSVRIYFDTAAEYRFSYLEFFSTDGVTFVLQAPVSISVTQLLANKRSDGTFYFDVTVQSVGIGNRYALPAGSIVGVRNPPTGIVRVENVADFQVTSPDQNNFDVVNSMFKNLGLRNLVGRASIRAPLLDTFPGILDIFVAGATHPQMVRDILTLNINGQPKQVHIGGLVDVWVNTTSLVQRQVVFSYLPSGQLLRIVSADEAQANELLYSFAQTFLTIDGEYASPDNLGVVLDEACAILFDINGIASQGFVLGGVADDRYRLAATDVVSGQEMLILPVPGNTGAHARESIYLADVSGINLKNTTTEVGDLIDVGGVRTITAKSGRVIEVGPNKTRTSNGYFTFDDNQGAIHVVGGDRFVPNVNASIVGLVNDRVVIVEGAAAGEYRALKVDGTGAWLGQPLAEGYLAYVSTDVPTGNQTYTWRNAANSAAGLLPPLVDETCWLYKGADGAYDQTTSKWIQIISVTRSSSGIQLVLKTGTGADITAGTVVQGLRGILNSGARVYFERSSSAHFGRMLRQDYTVGHTHYASVLEQPFLGAGVVGAVDYIAQPGLGVVAQVGDLLLFNGGFVPEGSRVLTGGDGSKLSLAVTEVLGYDKVRVGPSLGFDIPEGTAFTVVRNNLSLTGGIAVTTVDSVNHTLTFSSWPLGLGDGIGLIVTHVDTGSVKHVYFVVSSTAGNVRSALFKPTQQAVNIAFNTSGYVSASPSDVGAVVVQVDGSNTYTGTLSAYNNATRTWTVIPNDIIADAFTASGGPVSIQNGTARGIPATVSAPFSVGYYAPNIGDIGKIVRQGNYVGVLDSFDDPSYTWVIKPLSDNDLFDRTDVPTYIDYGSGAPFISPNTGWGTLRQPADNPVTNAGAVTITLDRSLDSDLINGATINIYSRFSKNGGFFDGHVFRVLPNSTISTTTPFAGVVGGDTPDKLLMLLGINYDSYDVDLVDTARPYEIGIKGSVTPDIIRIANAPKAQPLPLVSFIAGGSSSLSVPGSKLGIWGHAGRLLILVVGSNTYYLAIQAATSQDGISLFDPLPVTIYPDQGITYEIVEGFITPYFVLNPSLFNKYRVVRPPAIGEMMLVGAAGFHSSLTGFEHKFTDSTVNFFNTLGGVDLSVEEIQLFIDDGPLASDTGINVIGLIDATTLNLDVTFDQSAGPVAYHIARRNINNRTETWVTGVITDATHITLDSNTPTSPWDFGRNGTHREVALAVQSHPTLAGVNPFDFSQLVVTAFNPSTRVITVDTAVGHVVGSALLAPGTGFDASLFGKPVRVMPIINDRVATHKTGGSAVNTFNYYVKDFFTLPLARIQAVEVLDPQTLQPVRSVSYVLRVNDHGLRYSVKENNSLFIDDIDAIFQPIRVTYVADSSIGGIDSYLNDMDTEVLAANQLAKRMETISVDLAIKVRSEKDEATISALIATYINTLRSTEQLSKDKIIKYLYQQQAVSFVELESMIMNTIYYKFTGDAVSTPNVNETFGSDTACYLSNAISVTKLEPLT